VGQIQTENARARPGHQQGRHLALHAHARHARQQRRQALTIVWETSGNVIIANAIGKVHESVKEGETITAPLEASGVFPPMVVSMVDVGEQTGAMPEMLLKIADNYDEEVDNAVAAMTSLLEPIMIVFLAVIVGSIVIAMFLPLIQMITNMSGDDAGGGGGGKGGGD
jgi:type IV pilus assembly protein PilC